MFPEAIKHEISEINFSFHVNKRTLGKSLISFFQDFLAIIIKRFILA